MRRRAFDSSSRCSWRLLIRPSTRRRRVWSLTRSTSRVAGKSCSVPLPLLAPSSLSRRVPSGLYLARSLAVMVRGEAREEILEMEKAAFGLPSTCKKALLSCGTLAAGPHIDRRVTYEQIRHRFYRFGGTVREIFGDSHGISQAQNKQDQAVGNLDSETTSQIVTNRTDTSSPPDSTVGIFSSSLDDYRTKTTEVMSEYLEVRLARKAMADTWLKWRRDRDWKAFQQCVSALFLLPRKVTLNFREYGGLKLNDSKLESWSFGHLSALKVVNGSFGDLFELKESFGDHLCALKVIIDFASAAAIRDKTTLFHSSQSTDPLLDCMYYSEKVFYAFNATNAQGRTPRCQLHHIVSTVQKLELAPDEKLYL